MPKDFKQQLGDWAKEKGMDIKPPRSHTTKKTKERMNRRDWEDLMGVSRPTYSRKKGGAYRQR